MGRWGKVILFTLFGVLHPAAFGAEYSKILERDFSLRVRHPIQITNLRGDVTVEGWAQDRIRVKAVRKVQAGSQDEADKHFSALDLRFAERGNELELSAEYGQGLSIEERLLERQNPKTSMSLTIYAPSHLKVQVWTVDGAVHLRRWRAPVEVRTQSGAINVEGVDAENMSLLCPKCAITVRDTRSSVRCMGGEGNVLISSIKGEQIYVEGGAGSINSANVIGDQLYVTSAGNISGSGLKGSVEFHTGSGAVTLSDISGFASGKSVSGAVSVSARSWRYQDEAIFESSSGDISVSLPSPLHADVDLWSPHGLVQSDFKVQRMERPESFGPEATNRILGRVGVGGEVLKIFSESGKVLLSQSHLLGTRR